MVTVMIGFGFGSPLVALLMLIGTSLVSYLLYRLSTRNMRNKTHTSRAEMRQYYYEQRRVAREMSERFDLSDEEIERKLDEEFGPQKD